jgi:hypothetical protein
MNIHEQHVAELFEAQEAFNEAFAKINEVYAASVQRSRSKLFAALNGESPRPAVNMKSLADEISNSEKPDDDGSHERTDSAGQPQ